MFRFRSFLGSFYLLSTDVRFCYFRLLTISLRVPVFASFALPVIVVSLLFSHAFFYLIFFIRFTLIASTFSTFRCPVSIVALIRLCFSDLLSFSHVVYLNLSNCLSSTSVFALCFLLSIHVLPLYPSPFSNSPFSLPSSLSLCLSNSHQSTHTLRRHQASVLCGLVLRAGDAAR